MITNLVDNFLLFIFVMNLLQDVFDQIAVSRLNLIKECYHDVQFFIEVLDF